MTDPTVILLIYYVYVLLREDGITPLLHWQGKGNPLAASRAGRAEGNG